MCLTHVRESHWNRYRVWKPLGLLAVAGLTPPEWVVTVFDENVRVPDYAALPRPDLVGITAFTSQAHRAYEIADGFRGRGVPVVMGGIHATMCAEAAAARVDVIVTGEAEPVWAEVLVDVQRGALRARYDGAHADMNAIPPARHDLVNGDYAFGSIQTTRGCPLNCSFCSVTAFNGYRNFGGRELAREMEICDSTFYSLPRIAQRVWRSLWQRRNALIALLGSMSYRRNLGFGRRACREFLSSRRAAPEYV